MGGFVGAAGISACSARAFLFSFCRAGSLLRAAQAPVCCFSKDLRLCPFTSAYLRFSAWRRRKRKGDVLRALDNRCIALPFLTLKGSVSRVALRFRWTG